MVQQAVRPFFLLQYNWFKMMEYSQQELLKFYTSYSGHNVYSVSFHYQAEKPERKAPLNFHLSRREAREILASIRWDQNHQSAMRVKQLLEQRPAPGPFDLFR
jgi:hypothetical protein